LHLLNEVDAEVEVAEEFELLIGADVDVASPWRLRATGPEDP
jgi:hypothetical protein